MKIYFKAESIEVNHSEDGLDITADIDKSQYSELVDSLDPTDIIRTLGYEDVLDCIPTERILSYMSYIGIESKWEDE